jgi:hypothetical protein
MAFRASLFVGKPQDMLTIDVAFMAGYLMLRFTQRGNAFPFCVCPSVSSQFFRAAETILPYLTLRYL